MARKTTAQDASAEGLGESLVDSAQRIWLAGLGAFSRARTEGDNMFNVLVEQGKGLRERAREAADQALGTIRTQADSTLGQAQGQWGKLEQVFEERVSRSLNRLGVLTRQEVEDLSRQVQDLNDNVRELLRAKPGAAAKTAKARGTRASATRKTGAKKATRKAARKATRKATRKAKR